MERNGARTVRGRSFGQTGEAASVCALLITGARLTDPASGVDGVRDVCVAGGQIAEVAEGIDISRAAELAEGEELEVVDAGGLWLWPGLVDAHVHFREPGFTSKETVRTGSLAAAAGGYTTVVCEPNTDPPPDTPERLRRMAEIAESDAVVCVRFKATMTRGRRGGEPTDAAALAEAGAVALSDDGDPIVEPSVQEAVCRAAAEAGLPVAPHCEDSTRALERIRDGADPGFEPGPAHTNEARYIDRDIRAAMSAGCRIHVSHVSLARSVSTIERLREAGAEVTWEAAPHHLLLCADEYEPPQIPLVNPPLRSAADREALQVALVAGAVDAVASDHAPHTPEDKAGGARGLIGLETTLGLMLTHFIGEGGLTPSAAVELMSRRPARIFGLQAGSLAPGDPADMVLIDPDLEWRVEPDEFLSMGRNTPYAGWRLRGRALATWVGGEAAFARDRLAALTSSP
jgi:dihydroorotase